MPNDLPLARVNMNDGPSSGPSESGTSMSKGNSGSAVHGRQHRRDRRDRAAGRSGVVAGRAQGDDPGNADPTIACKSRVQRRCRERRWSLAWFVTARYRYALGSRTDPLAIFGALRRNASTTTSCASAGPTRTVANHINATAWAFHRSSVSVGGSMSMDSTDRVTPPDPVNA